MMSKGKRIIEVLTDENPDAIIYDGMDDALIGVFRGMANGIAGSYPEDAIAVYSYVKYIEIYVGNCCFRICGILGPGICY